jgi:hypothetical protein
MKTLYNFGASHAAGWGSKRSYSRIIADKFKLQYQDLAMAGSSTEYLLMSLQTHADKITDNDIVLIQLQPHFIHTTHYDSRLGYDKRHPSGLYNYSSMTLLDAEPDSEFVYGMKLYKTFVQTPEDLLFHYLIHINAIFDLIKEIPGTKFVFFDHIFRFPRITVPVVEQLESVLKANNVADSVIYTDFAKSVDVPDRYARLKNGEVDGIHFNESVHEKWADYILSKIGKHI